MAIRVEEDASVGRCHVVRRVIAFPESVGALLHHAAPVFPHERKRLGLHARAPQPLDEIVVGIGRSGAHGIGHVRHALKRPAPHLRRSRAANRHVGLAHPGHVPVAPALPDAATAIPKRFHCSCAHLRGDSRQVRDLFLSPKRARELVGAVEPEDYCPLLGGLSVESVLPVDEIPAFAVGHSRLAVSVSPLARI